MRRVQSTLLSTVWIRLTLFTWKFILNKIQFKVTLAAVRRWVGCAWKGERRQNRGSKKTQQAALKVIQARPGSTLSWCKRQETEKSAQMGNTIWRQKSWDKVPWKVKEREGIKGVSQASGLSKGVETEKTERKGVRWTRELTIRNSVSDMWNFQAGDQRSNDWTYFPLQLSK